MGCTVNEFFGLRLCDTDVDGFAEKFGSPRKSSQLLVFADRHGLWRGVTSGRFRTMFAREGVLFVPNEGGTSGPVRLATGCRNGPFPEFRSLVRLLARTEEDDATVFIIAGSAAVLSRAEENLRATFPRLRLVGRAVFSRSQEESIATAVRKAAPTVLIVGCNSRRIYPWISPVWQKLEHGLTVLAPRAVRKMAGMTPRVRPFRFVLLPLRIIDFFVLLGHRIVTGRRLRKAGV